MTCSADGCAGRPPRPVPHREEAFKLSSDPHFVEKVRDIVDLRKSPLDRAPMLSVGERLSSALSRSCRCCLVSPNGPTHDDKRKHATSLFAAPDVATGAVIGKCCERHRASEFLDFLKAIERNVPGGSTHTALAAWRITGVKRAAG